MIKRFIISGILLIMLSAFVCVVLWLYQNNNVPIHRIRIVVQDQQTVPPELADAIAAKLHGGFFSLDIAALRQQLLSISQVQEVALRRVWPDQLQVWISLKTPIARWRTGQLISSKGEVYTLASGAKLQDLPLIVAFSQHDIVKCIVTLKRYAQPLATNGLKITQIKLAQNGAYELNINNQFDLYLGSAHPEDNLKKFINVFPIIMKDNSGKKLKKVDMRYASGFAVRWVGEKETQLSTK